jgi:peptidoglycan hydrolase-like protein with peptidoglycan-binding domain
MLARSGALPEGRYDDDGKPLRGMDKNFAAPFPFYVGSNERQRSSCRQASSFGLQLQMEATMAEPILHKGSTDPAVRDLQEALKALGFNPGPIDGQFGTATETAVKAFQLQRGITADGVVGKVTWINIDEADQSEPELKIGSTGLPVRRAQKRMSLVGFDVGGVDGRYGSLTEAGVRKLQEQFSINVDGVVGKQTWSVIDSLESDAPAS